MKDSLDIRGVFPPVATPFVDGELALDKYEKNLEKWLKAGVNGVLVLGSNGEAVHLSKKEKLNLVKSTVDKVPDEKTVIVGSGCLTTAETIQFTNKTANIGVDAALIVSPYYYSGDMDQKSLLNHYSEIADNSSVPIMLYNVPKYTNTVIPLEVVKELSQHQNIVGMKDSSGNISYLAQISEITGDEFNLLVGTANAFFPALTLGVNGGILALSNIAPEECVKIYDLYQKGKEEQSRKLYQKMIPVNKAVTAEYGISGLKAAMDMLGFYGGLPRKPLLPLTAGEKNKLRVILKDKNLL